MLEDQASAVLQYIWSTEENVRRERHLWCAVLEAQQSLGLVVPSGALEAYRAAAHVVDLDSITRRELVTRHDVKARIEEFNDLAGYESIHLGLTSADVVDNVTWWKLRDSLVYLAKRAPRLQRVADTMPLRGIKGPMGTQQDQVELLGKDGARQLDRLVADRLGFEKLLTATGQVYHRSLDFQVLSELQHTVNGRGGPWFRVLSGFVTMAADYSGDTWNEGDVSTSVVRRVALPGACFAADLCLRNDSSGPGLTRGHVPA